MTYAFQAVGFARARRSLMWPHPNGEAAALTDALDSCGQALTRLDRSGFDTDVVRWLESLENLLGAHARTQFARAPVSPWSTLEQEQFANLVDVLADWFNLHLWSTS